MNSGRLHLHSMMVHAVVALALLAAGAYVLDAGTVVLAGAGPAVWRLLWLGGLAGLLVIAIPATVSGVGERNHLYANWPRSHRAKLVLSLVLLAVNLVALGAAVRLEGRPILLAWLAVLVVLVNPVVVTALALLGLHITLGRVSLAGTSYVPDMDREPPVDILVQAAAQAAEAPKMLDLEEELSA